MNMRMRLDTPSPDRVVAITKRCPMCGAPGEVELDADGLFRWWNGELVQDALPDLSVGLREQLITGLHLSCADELYGSTAHAEEEGG